MVSAEEKKETTEESADLGTLSGSWLMMSGACKPPISGGELAAMGPASGIAATECRVIV